MISSHFWVALSASFWIIPREGTEALLIVIMILTALRESGRGDKQSVVVWNCVAACIAGLLLALGCLSLQHIFSGQNRELSEGFASLIAMAMLLYVNFSVFQGMGDLQKKTLWGLGFMTFISVFRELGETILFYVGLLQGDLSQQVGTMTGIVLGVFLFACLIGCYRFATSQWRLLNRVIFNLAPFFIFILALMCIGNAIGAFQEAGWLSLTPIPGMINSDLWHIQASHEYILSIAVFLSSTALLFCKQFIKNTRQLYALFSNNKG